MKTAPLFDEVCYAAVVFATRGASVGFVERITRPRKLSGAGFDTTTGLVSGKLVVAAVPPKGLPSEQLPDFVRMLAAMQAAYRPQLVLGAGFAAANSNDLKPGTPVVAQQVRSKQQSPLTMSATVSQAKAVRVATFGESEGDVQADWAYPFAAACLERETPAALVAMVDREAKDQPTAEVANVMRQTSAPGKMGALLRAAWKKPTSLPKLWQQQEHRWEYQEELADAIGAVLALT